MFIYLAVCGGRVVSQRTLPVALWTNPLPASPRGLPPNGMLATSRVPAERSDPGGPGDGGGRRGSGGSGNGGENGRRGESAARRAETARAARAARAVRAAGAADHGGSSRSGESGEKERERAARGREGSGADGESGKGDEGVCDVCCEESRRFRGRARAATLRSHHNDRECCGCARALTTWFVLFNRPFRGCCGICGLHFARARPTQLIDGCHARRQRIGSASVAMSRTGVTRAVGPSIPAEHSRVPAYRLLRIEASPLVERSLPAHSARRQLRNRCCHGAPMVASIATLRCSVPAMSQAATRVLRHLADQMLPATRLLWWA